MAVDYLRDYLGIDPTDYSAMERTIAGVSPVGQSIIPNMGVPSTPQQRMIDATPIPFSPMPMQNFGSQITGLEEQISKLMEQMGELEAEKNAALQQQDVMRAELAQAQQDALTEQASEFEGVKSGLEQQIADLTAQIGNTQTPTDPRTLTKDVRIPGIAKKDIDYGYGPGIMPPLPDDFGMIGLRKPPSIGGIKNPDGTIRGSEPPSIERPLERLPSGPRRQDFMSINRLGRDAMDIPPPMPSPVAPIPPGIPPMTPPMTPRPRPRPVPMPQPMTPSMPVPQPIAPAPISIMGQPLSGADLELARSSGRGGLKGVFSSLKDFIAQNPDKTRQGGGFLGSRVKTPMSQPQKTMDMPRMGGARGGFSGAIRPMMMRAGGGGISKAIVDLQSRLK